MQERRPARVISLLSGGLDSCLAVRVLQQQSATVIGLSFTTPFFGAALAHKAARQLNIPLIIKDITPEHLKLVKAPLYGYGKTMNPCIDCHALMLRVAGQLMEEQQADALATGEVLGQRPMSQNRRALQVVAKHSGYEEYIIRPLCAQLLAPTKPEQEGIIDRSKLLALNGRSRKPQIAMAAQFGITEYPNPAGGCLLTDQGFSRRLRDLLAHQPDPAIREFELLRYGRQVRLSGQSKLLVGRDATDNEFLRQRYDAQRDVLLYTENFPGPTCLLVGQISSQETERAAAICAAYSDAPAGQACMVHISSPDGQRRQSIAADKNQRLQPGDWV